tara:strand:+ start:356 stop:1543 length:1188 start_codon:yes stop_codon:yes gene_type:complete
MSQHDFNIANQSFPATRTDLNNALVALASNSSGDAEPATKYANQWWYETDTNTLKLRNEANDAWISIAVLDQSGGSVQSITTAGLTLGSTAISASGAEINQLDAITRGSILYGNASGATARLAKGGAGTFLSSDGTDISWGSVAAGIPAVVYPSDWTSPTNNYTSSATWSKGSLSDDDYVWFYLVGGGGGGGSHGSQTHGGAGGKCIMLYGKAGVFNGAAYVIGAATAGNLNDFNSSVGTNTTVTLSSANGSTVFTTVSSSDVASNYFFSVSNANFDNIPLSESSSDLKVIATESDPMAWTDGGLPTGYVYKYFSKLRVYDDPQAAPNSVFSGGSGGAFYQNEKLPGASQLAGNGGATGTNGANGTAPGGGGGGSKSTSNRGGTGAQGALRVYHV